MILLLAVPAAAEEAGLVSELETLVPGETGSVVLAYDVTASGRAENCTVERSSGFSRLDAASCEMMLRYGRFPLASGDVRASRTIRWVTPTARDREPPSALQAPSPRMSAGTAGDWASLNPGWGRSSDD